MIQLELFEKVKQIKIVSKQGYKLLNLVVCDVKEFIINQSIESSLWLYIDGVQLNPVSVNTDIISTAKEIILTRPLWSVA